jgi:hypothetical protein
VAELTAALATAQQEHIAAAQIAADAHREEMGILQMQINQLVEVMQSAQAAGSNEQVAALQAQIASMQQQVEDEAEAADAEEEAAVETAEEAGALEPWYDRYRTHLYVGGGLAALAALYYFFFRPRTAMHLPVPTTPKSPSGLAANPTYRYRKGYRKTRRPPNSIWVKSYEYRNAQGKLVRVKGHWRTK